MKRYERYKDSGIEWIGEIPEKWKIESLQVSAKKAKYSFTGGPFGSDLKSNEYTVTGVRIIQLQNIGVGVFKDDYKIYTTEEKADELFNSNIFPGDIIIAKMADPVARACIMPNSAERFLMASDGIRLVTDSDRFNTKFILYTLNSNYFSVQAEMNSSGTTRLRIGLNVLKKLKILVPPTREQNSIANFLDEKTLEIDSLISKKKRLVSLLKEERTAIINKAVTKGIDPDMKYKDSGIEWIGEIPEHWAAARMKNVATVIGRIGFRGYTIADIVSEESGVVSLSPGNIKNHTLDLNSCTYLSREKYHESPEIMVFENDIVLVKTGSTIGKVAIIPQGTPEMTLNPQLVVLKNISIENSFLYYLMISKYFQSYFKIYTAGGSTPAISQEKINNFKIIFPDSVEQKEIVSFIEAKTSKIDITIAKIKKEIALIDEYKSALINDVVTGKIDVRDAIKQNQDKLQEAHQ